MISQFVSIFFHPLDSNLNRLCLSGSRADAYFVDSQNQTVCDLTVLELAGALPVLEVLAWNLETKLSLIFTVGRTIDHKPTVQIKIRHIELDIETEDEDKDEKDEEGSGDHGRDTNRDERSSSSSPTDPSAEASILLAIEGLVPPSVEPSPSTPILPSSLPPRLLPLDG